MYGLWAQYPYPSSLATGIGVLGQGTSQPDRWSYYYDHLSGWLIHMLLLRTTDYLLWLGNILLSRYRANGLLYWCLLGTGYLVSRD